MINKVKAYCDERLLEFNFITKERKVILEKLAAYIRKKKSENQSINLVYVCTHNSRRSQLGQVWSNIAANYFNIKNVYTYSGGTEITAFNDNAINALIRVGVEVIKINEEINPKYEIYFDNNKKPIVCFSKLYNNNINPKNDFAAIMTCGEAEQNCPFIPHLDLRIATTYNDPKFYDDSVFKNQKYDECCKQIATEIFYVFSKVID